MSGIFYSRPALNKTPFVKEGDILKNGETIGLIEVMKSFYPIVYEGKNDAIVERIVVEDGMEVLENQPLVTLKKV